MFKNFSFLINQFKERISIIKMTTRKTQKPVAESSKTKPIQEEVLEEEVEQPKKRTKKVAAPVVKTEEVVVVEEEVVEDDVKEKRKTTPTREGFLQSFDELVSSVEKEIESLRESKSKVKGVKFLRSLNKQIKLLKNQAGRVIKQKSSSGRKNTNTTSGFLKPVKISKEMAKFTGWDESELRSRVDVTKYLCNYIKENDLQNPTDRRQIMADPKLSKLLKFDSKKESEPLTYYKLQTYLKSHFIKPEVAATA